jgi:hypothetical protein
VWLSQATNSVRAQRFARTNAIGAILLSLAGNAAWHLIAANLLAVSWPIVLGVGSVPALVLGLVSHLAVLRSQVGSAPLGDAVRTPSPRTEPAEAPEVVTPPDEGARRLADEQLLEAARTADAAWRAEHDGRAINRDALRRALRVSGQRASVVLRELRAEAAAGTATKYGRPTT